MSRTEFITRGDCEAVELAPGLFLRVFASGKQGSKGLTTCCVTAGPGAAIPYHTHPTGESITVVEGEADAMVEGRRYRLGPFDSIYVPPGVAHSVRNPSADKPVVIHTAFPTEAVEREFVEDNFTDIQRESTGDDCPERLVRFANAEAYEVGQGVEARDLFAKRLGSDGICGGYGLFPPGEGLPCHTHVYDESITIVEGVSVCQVAGQQYEVSNMDTVCVPTGRPHRFFNDSDKPMVMIWVYAGDEPDRELVDQGQCDGTC
jgi:quercetin dioxygenase-like cupin family protein